MKKEYTVYFEAVTVEAEDKQEAEKLAIEDIKEYPYIKEIEEG